MKKTYGIPLFLLIRYIILLQIAKFSEPNNTKYLVPLSNLMRNPFAPNQSFI